MKIHVRELAERLDLPLNTLERWIRQGRIPVYREGSRCVFRRAALEKWAAAHNLSFAPPGQPDRAGKEPEDRLDNLLPAMERGGVLYDIFAENPESLLREVEILGCWEEGL